MPQRTAKNKIFKNRSFSETEFTTDNLCFKKFDFPGGPAIKNLPFSAGDTGLLSGWEESTCPRGK